jgi:hypothetical protein
MNKESYGIYSDFTLKETAKKVTMEIIGKKKHIIFQLQEKGKSGKIYGPYIGYIKNGKAVIKLNKMSGGSGYDYAWDNSQLKNTFLNYCYYTNTNRNRNSYNFKFQFI